MNDDIVKQISENMMKGHVRCVFIYQHLGLGDHIVCNGLTREIFKKESDASHFFMPVKKHNIGTMSRMYSDEKRLTLIPVYGDWNEIFNLPHIKYCSNIYMIGHHTTRSDWDVSFYDCIGVPFDRRWSSFKVSRDIEKERDLESKVNPSGEPFILIHDTASWGTCPVHTRKDIKIIQVTPVTESLLDWCGMIEKAVEVHCIDSSFIHLCMSMGREGTYHDFRKDSSWGAHFSMPSNWKIQRYTNINGINIPFALR